VTHEVIVPNRREFLFANRQPFLDEAKMPAYKKTLDPFVEGSEQPEEDFRVNK
jgi:hypothetical protein